MNIFAFGCGGHDGATQEQLDQARQQGAKYAKAKAELKELKAEFNKLKKQGKKQNQGGRWG